MAEYVIAGVGIVADDGDGSQVPVAGDGIVAEAAVVAADEISAKFIGRQYAKGLGRNPYLFHRAQDTSAPPPPEQGDAASGILVVPSWGAYRLTRASRLYYHKPAVDVHVVPEPPTWQPFLVRRPFRRYAHNRYRFHVSPHDSAPIVAEPPTHPPHPTRPKDRLEARYKHAMGARTRYNFHHATDGGVVVAGFKAWWAEDVNLIVEDDGITR